jgi:hypothetical protein
VIAITTPEEKTVRVKLLVGIQNQIKRIGLLGGTKKLDWKVEGDAIAVTLPENIYQQQKNGFVLKVALK